MLFVLKQEEMVAFVLERHRENIADMEVSCYYDYIPMELSDQIIPEP